MVFVEAVDFNWRGLPTRLPSDYYVSKFEVTQGLWKEVAGFSASNGWSCGLRCPVDAVSWHDCIIFCNQLNENLGLDPCYFNDEKFTTVYGKNVGGSYEYSYAGPVFWKHSCKGYRLPIESEWEYAAKGGKYSRGTIFAGSNNLDEVAWNEGNNSPGGAKAVGTKLPNELGLSDMSGNLFEFCFDVFVSYDYGYEKYQYFDFCDEDESRHEHVVRGGAFIYDIGNCRIEQRQRHGPGGTWIVGFRLFRSR